MVFSPGCGPRERTPAIAARHAARVRSWLARNPRSMHEPEENVRNAMTKCSATEAVGYDA